MRRTQRVVLLLILATATLYWPVGDHEFIEFDDDRYVFQNSRVLAGLSWEGVGWAFTTTKASNWHPLTWLSHMLDAQLFGAQPRGHHLTSLLLHVINTVLLFLLLQRMTGAFWPSAFVAALFGLHPLHVESVAWVSERKDVLSTFWLWCSLWLYQSWVQAPGARRYGALVVTFVLGLLSKSMLVTLPFMLLLLDYWPLGRLALESGSVWARVREKWPLFLLSALFCVVTVWTQSGGQALIGTDRFPIEVRVANAGISYVTYLAKMFWPWPLAAYYPHPVAVPWAQALGAGLLLGALSVGAIRLRDSHRPLGVGWCWYLGTLVPVIGLVQVGTQAMADRYTYVSLVGLFIVVAWGAPGLLAGWRHRQMALSVLGALALLASMVCTRGQIAYWRDTQTLFRHTLAVTERNPMAHGILGTALGRLGQVDEAIGHYREALRLKPDLAEAHNNLGIALQRKGLLAEATEHYREALRLKPDHPSAHNNLGTTLHTQGRLTEAIAHYRRALRVEPHSVQVLSNLAVALETEGRVEEAILRYREALRYQPNEGKLHRNLGQTLVSQGQLTEAADHFRRALRIDPDDEKARALLQRVRHGAGASTLQE